MKTILIVDDERALRELLRDTFELRGYKCLTAKNGREALKIAKKELPSLIILDLIMPVMDGAQTHKALKADASTRDIPVIAYTAQDHEIVAKKGIEAFDVVSYVLKPFDTEALVKTVENAVSKIEK